MSLRVSLVLPLAFGLVTACSGEKSEGTDTTDDTTEPVGDDDDDDVSGDDDDDDDSTTPYSDLSIDAAVLTMVGAFAYDETTNMVVPFEDPNYGLQPISISILISDSSVQTSGVTAANTCTVTLSTNTPQPLIAVDDIGAWWGFEMPSDADVTTECYAELPAEWGGDPAPHVTAWSWGFVIDSLDPTISAQLESQVSPADWPQLEPYLMGGGGFTDALVGVLNDDGYLIGYGQALAADDDFAVVAGTSGYAEQILAVDAWDEKTLTPARGIYLMGSGSVGPANLIVVQ